MRFASVGIWLLLAASGPLRAQANASDLKAALLLRVAELERNIAREGHQVFIYVMGAPELASALRKLKGNHVGKATLDRIELGSSLPDAPVDILFVGTNRELKAVIEFSRKNRVMTVTDRLDLFQKGLSVSIIMEQPKPRVSLNPGASLREGLDWDLDFSRFQSLTLEFKSVH